MPVRDHFRSPLDDIHSWEGLHGGWPAMIVRDMIELLPEPYFAAHFVFLGTLRENPYREYSGTMPESTTGASDCGGVAVGPDAPP